MAGRVRTNLMHAWNAFTQNDTSPQNVGGYGSYFSGRPDRPKLYVSNERSIISSIYMRMAIDVSAASIRHIRTDDEERYVSDIDSGLNECLRISTNLDQAARAFRQDIAATLFDKGVAAIIPTDTTVNPLITGGYDIRTMRVGDVVAWYPNHVRVDVYRESRGQREEIVLPKSMVAIVQNPLYAVMNERNSTLQRLIRKLNLLDSVDEQSASGKLDLIIQLPYVIKSESRMKQAEQRRNDIQQQLRGSQYGIAYTDGTEKITQLNRPAENNLMGQIEYLTEMLYSQLGLTAEILNGTADNQAILHYLDRTIEPILDAITEEMTRKFLTKTARSQKQKVTYFRDPFKLVPMEVLSEMADKFTRNEILTSNEIRQIVGMKPSSDPKADQLINSNMPVSDTDPTGVGVVSDEDEEVFDSAMNEVDSMVDSLLQEFGGEADA